MATTFISRNPANDQVLAEYGQHTDEQVLAAVAEADSGFRTWRNTSVAERSKILVRVAELYRRNQATLAEIISLEMGKPIKQAYGEVSVSADIYEYYARNAEHFIADEDLVVASGGKAVVKTAPIGVLLGIMPWNYPYYQVARFAAPNLMLGNTILLKHAQNCPQAAVAIEELFTEAGLPRYAYQNLFASHDQISTIIADDRVLGVSLTGSERAGAIVAEQAGRHLKKVVLELGGSDPFIVLDDHDLDRTVRKAVTGRISNAGQACTSPKRIIVLAEVYDRFLDAFTPAYTKHQPGDQLSEETLLGPLSTRAARDEVLRQVQETTAAGATLVSGGTAVGDHGAYLTPALLTDITPAMPAWSEEIFGPVAAVYKAKDIDEAVAIANDTPYGLGAVVFSGDEALALEVADRLDSGMVTINDNTDSEPDLPFGGIKRSGFGRELGKFGFDEFANKKLIRVAAE